MLFTNYKYFVDNADGILKKIDTSDLKSKKDYIAAISKLLSVKRVNNDVLEKYKKAMSFHKDNENKIRGDNKAKSSDVEKTNNMSLEDIQNKIKQYSIMDNHRYSDYTR